MSEIKITWDNQRHLFWIRSIRELNGSTFLGIDALFEDKETFRKFSEEVLSMPEWDVLP